MASPLSIRSSIAGSGASLTAWPLALLQLGATLVLLALVHHDGLVSVAAIWSSSDTYGHGWFMVPIATWLAWRNRSALVGIEPRTCWLGLLALAGVELLGVAANIAGVAFAQHLTLMALIPAVVLTLLGPRVTRAMAFPLGYLIFAVPWGEAFIPVLQDITAWMSVNLLELSGIPVLWEGRLISIPVGDFEVAEACSGVRYVIASLALGALFAYLAYRSPWRRMAFLAAAALVPIVANGFRAYGIIMIAHWSDMRLAVGVDHLIYGWLFFGFVMLLLLWLGSLWREPTERSGRVVTVTAGGTSPRAGLIVRSGAATAVLAIAGIASILPQWSAQAQLTVRTAVLLPAPAPQWERTPADRPEWLMGFEGADDIRHAIYGGAGIGQVELISVHYRRERQGAELINAANQLHGDRWNWLGSTQRTLEVGGSGLDVRELRLRRDGEHRLIWSWYEVGGWQTSRDTVAKILSALLRLTGQRGEATLVVLAAPYDTRSGEAVVRLQTFLRDHPRVMTAGGLVVEQ